VRLVSTYRLVNMCDFQLLGSFEDNIIYFGYLVDINYCVCKVYNNSSDTELLNIQGGTIYALLGCLYMKLECLSRGFCDRKIFMKKVQRGLFKYWNFTSCSFMKKLKHRSFGKFAYEVREQLAWFYEKGCALSEVSINLNSPVGCMLSCDPV
jgi:hypothetical protein